MQKFLVAIMLVFGSCATVELSAEPAELVPVVAKKTSWIFFFYDEKNRSANRVMAVDASLPPLRKDNIYLGEKVWGLPCINGSLDETCFIFPESPGIEVGLDKSGQALARQVSEGCRLTFKGIKVSFHPTNINNVKGYLYKFSPDDEETVRKDGDCP